jgi:hypothetical protein
LRCRGAPDSSAAQPRLRLATALSSAGAGSAGDTKGDVDTPHGRAILASPGGSRTAAVMTRSRTISKPVGASTFGDSGPLGGGGCGERCRHRYRRSGLGWRLADDTGAR